MGAEKFLAALDLLKGFNVNLYVGEEVFKGKLIGVETDHVVLETENKYIFYYNIDQIQAITKNTKQFQPKKSKANFHKTQSLLELLHSLQHSWVRILSVNKQRFSGVLSEIDADFATLINGEERILIKLSHVSNILKGVIKEEEKKPKAPQEHPKKGNEAKEKEAPFPQKAKDTPEKIIKSSTNETLITPEKETIINSQIDETENQQEVKIQTEAIVPNNHREYSQPLTETDETKSTIEFTPNNLGSRIQEPEKVSLPKTTYKNEKDKSEIKKANSKTKKSSKEKKKSHHERKHKEEKNKESKTSKAIEKAVKTKHINEKAPQIKMEPTSTTILPSTKKEVKAVSEESSTKNQSFSIQNEQESNRFRFAGEPVSRDGEQTFPFAGWPKRSRKTYR